jgi:hypothetical protein
MLVKIIKYAMTPGFTKAKPSEFNPAENVMDILNTQKAFKEKLTEESKHGDRIKFNNVDIKKAKALYSDEMSRMKITEDKQNSQYHSHVSKGFLFVLLGVFFMALPIVGLFYDLGIRIPIISSFLPIYSYGVLVSMVPSIGVLLLIGIRHWYFAKMIILKQKFPFMQYLASLQLLPTKSEVIS